MKHCTKCDTSKPLDGFCVRSKSKDGRQPWCKDCSTRVFKGYYKDNPGAYRVRAVKIQKEAANLIHELKDNQPCMDCGVRYPAFVLDYDHRDPSIKIDNVPAICAAGKKKVLEEIAKCDLVCANCHRMRTHKGLPTKWKRTN